MRKILRQPLLNAAVAACGVIDKSDPTYCISKHIIPAAIRIIKYIICRSETG